MNTTLFAVLRVGPLGITPSWPAKIRFYDKLPEWAEDWEHVARHAAHGEGQAYVFSLCTGDFASESDETVLVGHELNAFETNTEAVFPEEALEEDEADEDGRYELGCSGKTKNGVPCQRAIVGILGYNGAFEHPQLGYADLRNSIWLCWQHGKE